MGLSSAAILGHVRRGVILMAHNSTLVFRIWLYDLGHLRQASGENDRTGSVLQQTQTMLIENFST